MEGLVRPWWASALLLAGCGSYWDLPKGESLNYGCDGEVRWYVDADADGFGALGSDYETSCEPVSGRSPNQRDCDDADASITGRVGSICPQDIGAGEEFGPSPTDCFAVVAAQNVEYLGTCGVPVLRSNSASEACEAWAGLPTEGEIRGLAALDQQSAVVEELLSTLAAEVPAFAVWVDLRWDGAGWVLPDGTEPTSGYPYCGGTPPTPGDFFPDLNLNDPDAIATVEAATPQLRMALVPDGAGWCLGVPQLSTGMAPGTAFPLCQRPVPVGLDYVEAASAGDGGDPAR